MSLIQDFSNANDHQQWRMITDLFAQVVDIDSQDREAWIAAQELDSETASRLKDMLGTLDKTISLLDTPFSSRIQLQENWYADQWVGKNINGYQLEALLHEGVIAGVFLARQSEPVERKVVIKLIRPDAPSEYSDFFRFEQKALARLSHPNIATIHTVEKTSEGLTFIVMEYVRGTTLKDYCDENTLTIRQRLELFLSICDAISYSHQRGVLHRDLKSSNIMVSKFENKATPTIIDFGISGDLNNEVRWSHQHSVGTPEYMSPEHVLNVDELDPRADVFSLGRVLFTLLVGRMPFERTLIQDLEPAERLSLIVEYDPGLPSVHFAAASLDAQTLLAKERGTGVNRLSKDLSNELDSIYRKATEKDKQNRYQSVGELARDIRSYLSNDIVQAHPSSFLYKSTKFLKRHYIASIAGSTLLLLSSLFVYSTINQNLKIKDEILRAQTEKQNAEQVAAMVMETISIANPSGVTSQGRGSVEGILDRGLDQLKSAEGISDNIRAELLLAIAEGYVGIQKPNASREINAFIQDTLNVNDPEIIVRALLASANTEEISSRFEAQLATAEKAYQFCIDKNISGSLLVQSKAELGDAHLLMDNYRKALAFFNEAFELYNSEKLVDEILLAEMHDRLASVHAKLANYDDTKTHLNLAKTLSSKYFDDLHPKLLGLELLEIMVNQTLREGLPLSPRLERLVEKNVMVWGEQSIHTVAVLNELAFSYSKEGRHQDSIDTSLRNLEILKVIEPEPSDQTLYNLASLTSNYSYSGNSEQALKVAKEAYDLAVGELNGSPRFADYKQSEAALVYAQSLALEGQLQDSLKFYDQAIKTFSEEDNRYDYYLSWALLERSIVLANMGFVGLAQRDANAGHEISKLFYPEEHINLLRSESIVIYTNLLAKWDELEFATLKDKWIQFDIESLNKNHKLYNKVAAFIEQRTR